MGSDVSDESIHRGCGIIDAQENPTPKLRVHNFSISLDGYAAAPNQRLDHPFGEGDPGLHEWMFATRTGRQSSGTTAYEGLDDEFAAAGDVGIGATIMGRNMFGPIRGPRENDTWNGWWGDAHARFSRMPT